MSCWVGCIWYEPMRVSIIWSQARLISCNRSRSVSEIVGISSDCKHHGTCPFEYSVGLMYWKSPILSIVASRISWRNVCFPLDFCFAQGKTLSSGYLTAVQCGCLSSLPRYIEVDCSTEVATPQEWRKSSSRAVRLKGVQRTNIFSVVKASL